MVTTELMMLVPIDHYHSADDGSSGSDDHDEQISSSEGEQILSHTGTLGVIYLFLISGQKSLSATEDVTFNLSPHTSILAYKQLTHLPILAFQSGERLHLNCLCHVL